MKQPLNKFNASMTTTTSQLETNFSIKDLPSSIHASIYSAPETLFVAHGPSFVNFTANVKWVPQNGTFQPIIYHPPPLEINHNHHVEQEQRVLSKEWFDHFFSIAHQKYNSQEYVQAFQILQELHRMDNHHLPCLLLMGCTCYALKLYDLSIFYNNVILGIDSEFSEAYSNLGTTHRAIAQLHANAISENEEEVRAQQQQSLYYQSLAQQFYETAIALQPKYWDAAVNLAGLFCSRGQWTEAILCYERLESIYESELPIEERLSPSLCSTGFDWKQDIAVIKSLVYVEHRRHVSPFGFMYSVQGYSKERRRDLAFAKGNIHLSLCNSLEAKYEYLKGLVACNVNLIPLYQDSLNQSSMPPQQVSPQDALFALKQCNENTLEYETKSILSSMLQTLAKIYQDCNVFHLAVQLYYVSLQIYPTPNACNNLGIILSNHRREESIIWYEFGLSLDPKHVHLYTNLGSVLKDKGNIMQGISCYQKAISLQPDFYIALANLANVSKDMGHVEEALMLYKRALAVKPDFIEAFCNFVNSSLFICDWTDRTQNLQLLKDIVLKHLKVSSSALPPVLPFHTFTYSNLDPWIIREISRRHADKALWNVTSSSWFPGFPSRPGLLNDKGNVIEKQRRTYPYPYPLPPIHNKGILKIGYVSSDFTNHPLAHLMQSVFGFHDSTQFTIYCYSLSPSDGSEYRKKIERDCHYFVDVSQWETQDIVQQILSDGIHILCNLNGYTKGGRNEIFAARPCPIQVSLMGFAGTMGAGTIYDPVHCPEDSRQSEGTFFADISRRWMDYLVADEVTCPRALVCGDKSDTNYVDDSTRVYTEGILYMPHTYFVNDHKQGFREPVDVDMKALFDSDSFQINRKWDQEQGLSSSECKEWRMELCKRLKMRRELFPDLLEDTIIFANFNQLYKIDPDIFMTWLRILSRVKNSVLWLLRFPPSGESNLLNLALMSFGKEISSRILFTDVAPKHIHIHRGRVADIFLDTPECNAHTTAADILWSGTPIITFPKYDFKMCSRVAASICYATGHWRNLSHSVFKTSCIKNVERLSKDPHLLGHTMVVGSYSEYEERSVYLANSISWNWKPLCRESCEIHPPAYTSDAFYPNVTNPTHIYSPSGLAIQLRQELFLNREAMPVFDTQLWVRDLENGFIKAFDKWKREYASISESVSCISQDSLQKCIHI